MSVDKSLTVSLEEFGLSQYEARAYFAMISRGPVSAAELSYYSEIPRTKVYPTLQKLRKKRLATISDTKPIMCSAVAPEEAFDSTIQDQINRVNAMNSLISSLKAVNDESRRSHGVEEKRYQQLSTANTISEMHGLIDGSRHSIDIASQRSYVSESRKQIVAASRRGILVRIILPPAEVNADGTDILPGGVRIRTTMHNYNYVISDGGNVLVLNETGGGEALSMADGIMYNLTTLFESLWGSAVKADSLLDLTRKESKDAYTAISILKESGFSVSLQAAISGNTPDLADLLESEGVHIYDKTLNDLVDLASVSLKVIGKGSAKLDLSNGAISLKSEGNSGHALAWALVLDSYLKKHGYNTRIVPQKESKDIHIRLEKTQK